MECACAGLIYYSVKLLTSASNINLYSEIMGYNPYWPQQNNNDQKHL